MTLAVVQTAQNSGTGTSLTVTLGSATTPGNFLAVLVLTTAGTNGSVSSVSLGGAAGNFGSIVSQGNSSDHAIVTCWGDPDCAGGQTAVAITTTGSSGTQAISAIVFEISGMPSTLTGILDKSAVLSSSGFVTSWTLGPTATTTQADEMWLAIVGGNVSSSTAGTYTGPGSAWTNTVLSGVNNYTGGFSAGGVAGYQVVSSTGTASYNGTCTSSTLDGLVLTLKASSTTPVSVADTGAGDDSGFTLAVAVPLAESGSAADSAAVAVAAPSADTGAGSEAQAPYDSTYTAGYAVRFAPASDVTLTDPDATFGDDSDFTAGLLATDTGTG